MLTQSNRRKDSWQRSLIPAESTCYWASGIWVFFPFAWLFSSPLKFCFYKVCWTVPTPYLSASLLTDRRDGIHFLIFLSQGQVCYIQGW